MSHIYSNILSGSLAGRKMLAVLIDPEKVVGERLISFVKELERVRPDLILVGGSQFKLSLCRCVEEIKLHTTLPVLAFPASAFQLSTNVDGVLFLSLISGRNAQLLIGEHVKAAPMLRELELEVIPTGYILVDGGLDSAVVRVSETAPLSQLDLPQIVSTALAGAYLGHKLIYLEAGSGAHQVVSPSVVRAVSEQLSVPLIVGGGIDSVQKMLAAFDAGADLVVIGNHFEQHPEEVGLFYDAIRRYTLK